MLSRVQQIAPLRRPRGVIRQPEHGWHSATGDLTPLRGRLHTSAREWGGNTGNPYGPVTRKRMYRDLAPPIAQIQTRDPSSNCNPTRVNDVQWGQNVRAQVVVRTTALISGLEVTTAPCCKFPRQALPNLTQRCNVVRSGCPMPITTLRRSGTYIGSLISLAGSAVCPLVPPLVMSTSVHVGLFGWFGMKVSYRCQWRLV